MNAFDVIVLIGLTSSGISIVQPRLEVEVEVGTSGVPSVGAGWARSGAGGRQQY